MNTSIYLDANVFIKAVEADDAEAELAWVMLHAIAPGEINGLTSELTLAEVLPKPIADGDHQLVRTYEGTLRSGAALIVVPVTRSILRKAAAIRSRVEKIRLPDAIHIATAVQHECTALISNDLRVRNNGELRIISLTSLTFDKLKTLLS